MTDTLEGAGGHAGVDPSRDVERDRASFYLTGRRMDTRLGNVEGLGLRSAQLAPYRRLDELRYEYPVDPVPDGRTPQQELARLARSGAIERYPDGVPAKVAAQIEHELMLIEQLGYAPYFLTVHDIVRDARSQIGRAHV